MTTDKAWLAHLGRIVEVDGIDADPVSLVRLAVSARECGVSGVLIDLMLDPFEPHAPRLRAFSKVAMWAASAADDCRGGAIARAVPAPESSRLDELVHSD